MFPVLFQIRGAVLSSYSVFFGLACVVGILVWSYFSVRRDLPGERTITLGIFTVICAWLGARALFVMTNWSSFGEQFSFWKIWEGGIVFYGGFLSGAAYLIWALRKGAIPMVSSLCALAPALALAHAIGRVGCFANGCCFGPRCEWPWSVTYTHLWSAARPLNVGLHPVQLYEAGGLLVLFGLLVKWELDWRLLYKGAWMNSLRIYLLGYSALRFVLEFFRADPYRGAALGLTTSQWISLGIFIFACGVRFEFSQRKFA